MKRFFRYLYDCRRVCVWAVLTFAVFTVVFALYGIGLKAVWYPAAISAVFGVILLITGFVCRERRYKEMELIGSSGSLLSASWVEFRRAVIFLLLFYHALVGGRVCSFK